MKYKYRIYRKDNTFIDHADPYGFGMEMPPMSASVVNNLFSYKWNDENWMKKRTECKKLHLIYMRSIWGLGEENQTTHGILIGK